LIQFMSLGIPVVATPTGSNLEIIKDGVNGFLADTADEWYERLRLLSENAELRRSIGEAARETAKTHFSLVKQLEIIENIFRDPLATPALA
ncbi:MAG TPA: glycosyltransferase, partial [Pyrinomonadaceae bacterium]|nr:glycosyltransferase [Pyrinomonadaceae bacterium]